MNPFLKTSAEMNARQAQALREDIKRMQKSFASNDDIVFTLPKKKAANE